MKYLFFTILTLSFLGCQDVKKPERPENLISQETMVLILADAYISNAARSINNRLIRKTGVMLDSLLYEKYNIDSLQFVNSNAFYTSDLNTYSKIIQKVEVRLLIIQKKTDSLFKVYKKEKPGDTIKDSIQIKPNLLIDPVESTPYQDSIK